MPSSQKTLKWLIWMYRLSKTGYESRQGRKAMLRWLIQMRCLSKTYDAGKQEMLVI